MESNSKNSVSENYPNSNESVSLRKLSSDTSTNIVGAKIQNPSSNLNSNSTYPSISYETKGCSNSSAGLKATSANSGSSSWEKQGDDAKKDAMDLTASSANDLLLQDAMGSAPMSAIDEDEQIREAIRESLQTAQARISSEETLGGNEIALSCSKVGGFTTAGGGGFGGNVMVIDDDGKEISATAGAAPPVGSPSLLSSVSARQQQADEDLSRAIYESLQTQYHQRDGGSGGAGVGDGLSSLSNVGNERVVLSNGSGVAEADNPYERKRKSVAGRGEDGTEMWLPVGLKNVGNTCYFNSLLQTYFMIPAFRQGVFNILGRDISCNESESGDSMEGVLAKTEGEIIAGSDQSDANKENQPAGVHEINGELKGKMGNGDVGNALLKRKRASIACLRELQKVFGFLSLSNRKYIDPSDLINSLFCEDVSKEKKTNSITIGNQQDVGEFNSLFLEYIEEGVKGWEESSGTERSMEEADVSSPTRGWVVVKKPEAHGSMQLSSPVCSSPSLQEDLSSSKSDAGAEKSNPVQNLFYGTMVVRTEAKEKDGSAVLNTVKEKFTSLILDVNNYSELHESLDNYVERSEIENYETPLKHKTDAWKEVWFETFPPVLTFQLQRAFFDKATQKAEKIHNRFHFAKKIFVDRYMNSNMDLAKEIRKANAEHRRILVEEREKYEKHVNFKGSKISLKDSIENSVEYLKNCRLNAYPHPNDCPNICSDAEIKSGLALLQKVYGSVSDRMKKISEGIEAREQAIACSFDKQELKKMPYNLHAVLVHEGQTTGGHYWAFIFDRPSGSWRKYNDVNVTEVSEETVWNESFGGSGYASAYCLIYINEKCSDDDNTFLSEKGEKIVVSKNVPHWLKDLIQTDNDAFAKEMKEWDDRHTGGKSGVTLSDAICVDDLGKDEGQINAALADRLQKKRKSATDEDELNVKLSQVTTTADELQLSSRNSPQKGDEAVSGSTPEPCSSGFDRRRTYSQREEFDGEIGPREEVTGSPFLSIDDPCGFRTLSRRIEGTLRDIHLADNRSVSEAKENEENFSLKEWKVVCGSDRRLAHPLHYFQIITETGAFEILQNIGVISRTVRSDSVDLKRAIALEGTIRKVFNKSLCELSDQENEGYNTKCKFSGMLKLPLEENLQKICDQIVGYYSAFATVTKQILFSARQTSQLIRINERKYLSGHVTVHKQSALVNEAFVAIYMSVFENLKLILPGYSNTVSISHPCVHSLGFPMKLLLKLFNAVVFQLLLFTLSEAKALLAEPHQTDVKRSEYELLASDAVRISKGFVHVYYCLVSSDSEMSAKGLHPGVFRNGPLPKHIWENANYIWGPMFKDLEEIFLDERTPETLQEELLAFSEPSWNITSPVNATFDLSSDIAEMFPAANTKFRFSHEEEKLREFFTKVVLQRAWVEKAFEFES